MMPNFDFPQGVADCVAALHTVADLPEVDGGVGVIGFCLGGTLGYLTAAVASPDCCVSYYGSGIAGDARPARQHRRARCSSTSATPTSTSRATRSAPSRPRSRAGELFSLNTEAGRPRLRQPRGGDVLERGRGGVRVARDHRLPRPPPAGGLIAAPGASGQCTAERTAPTPEALPSGASRSQPKRSGGWRRRSSRTGRPGARVVPAARGRGGPTPPGSATRPRGVRTSSPCWMRKGSYTSSTVSVCSLTLMARVERPTGPPPNCWHRAPRMARSTLSSPRSSTPNSASPSPRHAPVDVARRPGPRRSRAPGAAAGWRCGACPGCGGRSPTRPRRRWSRRGCGPPA